MKLRYWVAIILLAMASVTFGGELPYLSNNDYIEFWIKMAINTDKPQAFEIKVSVNCENAVGATAIVSVNPEQILSSIA